MSSEASLPGQKPYNSYKHGFTSRKRTEAWLLEVDLMAEELVRGAPRTPEIMDAARMVSEQFLLLQAIRQERRRLLTTPPPPKGYENFLTWPECGDIKHEILNGDFVKEAPPLAWARNLIAYAHYDRVVDAYVPSSEGSAALLKCQPRAFTRLDTYERKARSRAAELVRHLDFLIIEERRKIVAASGVREN